VVPKNLKKSRPTEWHIRPKKGECVFPTIKFFRSDKIPCFNGLFIYSLQLGAHPLGGELKRNQRKDGTSIHQKILIGHFASCKAQFCMAR
jgi:hypothetical protein